MFSFVIVPERPNFLSLAEAEQRNLRRTTKKT